MYPDPVLLLAVLQLFSSEEKHVSQQHSVTVYGAPGSEPFTVFSITAQTTAKQLLDVVSAPAEMDVYLNSLKGLVTVSPSPSCRWWPPQEAQWTTSCARRRSHC